MLVNSHQKILKISASSILTHKVWIISRKNPRPKVIVNDINEVWSLDLTYVDQLARENPGVRYLLIAVDCLSRYFQLEPLKTKETAKAFKRNDQNKTAKNFWLTKHRVQRRIR